MFMRNLRVTTTHKGSSTPTKMSKIDGRQNPVKYKTKIDKINVLSASNMSDISEYNYEHAQKVWRAFNLQNLGE